MKFVVLLLIAVIGCSVAIPREEQGTFRSFTQFIKTHKKSYTATEFKQKYEIFKSNLKVIEDLNSRTKSATFGVTKFADMTPEEFKAIMLPSKMVKKPDWPTLPRVSKERISALPDSFDWRTKNVVTPVKDQGQCGSCWSFSTTGNIEGQWALAKKQLVSLSEQNLVDCDHNCMPYDGSQACDAGCNGGLMPNAYQYVLSKGIMSESDYPYTATDGSCKFDASKVAAHISNWTMVEGVEDEMAARLVELGPLSIAVDATLWQFYWSGVFDFPWCGSSLDHGVLIVGFGHQKDLIGEDVNYWLIKNSWGGSWGEQGYIKLYRGDDQCGVNLFVCSSLIGSTQ